MHRLSLLPAAVAALALAAPAAAAAPSYVPGEVIVGYEDGTTEQVKEKVTEAAGTEAAVPVPGAAAEQLKIEDGENVKTTVRELRRARTSPTRCRTTSRIQGDEPDCARAEMVDLPLHPQTFTLHGRSATDETMGRVIARCTSLA